MKMSSSTFNDLESILEQFARNEGGWPHLKAVYRLGRFPRADKVKDLWKRFRWDVFYLSGANKELRDRFAAEELDGSHIDTALKNIVPDPAKPEVYILTPEWTDCRGKCLQVEPEDLAEVFRCVARRVRSVPLVGDYLSDGRRIARIWRDSDGAKFQPTQDGSFFLLESGGDFSGGLDDPLPLSSLTRTNEVRMAEFWRFKWPAGPGRGWRFKIKVPIWKLENPNNAD